MLPLSCRLASRTAIRSALVIAMGLGLPLIGASFTGCGSGPKPPARGVIEGDIEGWGFRRDQGLLDVEVWVADNQGSAHTASYVRKSAEKTGSIEEADIVNAFITRYETSEGVKPALVQFARRLAQQSGYRVEEKSSADVRHFAVTASGEFWVFWSAKNYVIKLGGRGRESVPEDLIEAYGEYYPSEIKKGELEGRADVEDDPEIETQEIDPKDKVKARKRK